ncbi:glyoxylate reductase [Agrilactobacillus composti DSM 18527 = JCM 14202]|uniref:Glyoxylate reductase n=1 Tax=Agrilactobacillus composti DSM 18527 = JCM 14202 TaxID=1423734 RepID=X0QSQ4_9LACO|nr:2-hydroxyacid dehydrogenase family protein [Agrilactobacillus composti]KRM35562.1 glyoxylate reductase [Agrilactobacillus composti DSM 18527 = JCM 14202]GAF41635.1 glyoxylate reductase [Agrilactobacillus composti DSM 18527 = JCM 14202]
MAKVFIAVKIPQEAESLLTNAKIEVQEHTGNLLISKQQLIAAVPDADVLITALSTQVDKDVIDAGKNLKLIANYGAGFNNIDVAYAKEKGIPVTNTPLVSTDSTAELAVALILAISRRVVEGDRLMQTKGFNGWAPLFFLGHQVSHKTLGIIGMGQIGQGVAKRLKGFDMEILYTQHHRLDPKVEKELNAKFVSFDEVVAKADYLTLHLPLSASTTHLINADVFKKMKKTAFLINAARGPIVDESALAKAIKDEDIAGAALDVYENEPNVNPELKNLNNVILEPHIGNATIEARDAMAQIVAENTIAIVAGKEPKYIVNK